MIRKLLIRMIIYYVESHVSFTGMTPQGRERKRRICQKLWHEETTTVLQLSLYTGVLAILKDYVMVFQVFHFSGNYLYILMSLQYFIAHSMLSWFIS